jgi:RNA polymerase sigma-70 factor (ECF subfamily)
MSLDELLSHKTWLQKFAERVARNHALADDLVQETWLVALQWQASGQELARPWLARVLRNLARMRARGEVRRKQRELAFVDADASAPSPEALMYQGQAQQQLTRHVLELPEPYRSTLLLHYAEGLSASEIAARLDVPAGTVRWRHKHALALLRQSLHDAERRHDAPRPARRRALVPVPLLATMSPSARQTAGPVSVSGWLARLLAGKPLLGGVLALMVLLSIAVITWLLLSRGSTRPASDELSGESLQPAHLAALHAFMEDAASPPAGALPALLIDTWRPEAELIPASATRAIGGLQTGTGGRAGPSSPSSAGNGARRSSLRPDDARDGDCAGPDGSARPPHCDSASRAVQPPRCEASRLQGLMLLRLLERKQIMSRNQNNRWLAMMTIAALNMATQIGCTDLVPVDEELDLSGPGGSSGDDDGGDSPISCETAPRPDGTTCTVCMDPSTGATETTCHDDGEDPVPSDACFVEIDPTGTMCVTCVAPDGGLDTVCGNCTTELDPTGQVCTTCVDAAGNANTACEAAAPQESCFVEIDPTGAQCVTCVDGSGNSDTVCGNCTTEIDPAGQVCTTCVDAAGNANTACDAAVPQESCFVELDPTGAQCVTCVDGSGNSDTVCGNCTTELDPAGQVCTTCVDAAGNANTACDAVVPQESCFVELDPTGAQCVTCVDGSGNSDTVCGNCTTELDPAGQVCTTCVDAAGNANTACDAVVPQDYCFTEPDLSGRLCTTCVDETGNSTTDCENPVILPV